MYDWNEFKISHYFPQTLRIIKMLILWKINLNKPCQCSFMVRLLPDLKDCIHFYLMIVDNYLHHNQKAPQHPREALFPQIRPYLLRPHRMGESCVRVSRLWVKNKSVAKPAEIKVKASGVCSCWEQIITVDTGQWSRHYVCLWIMNERTAEGLSQHESEERKGAGWMPLLFLSSHWNDIQNKWIV